VAYEDLFGPKPAGEQPQSYGPALKA
jgi:hypothetical protein